MKKVMFFSFALATMCHLHADDQANFVQNAQDMVDRLSKARTVKITVTLWCDEENAQTDAWRGILDGATTTLTLSESGAQEAEIIDSVIKQLEALKTKTRSGLYGGTISVGLGDGKCSVDRCGQNCKCTRNGGVCACNAINGERCCGN